MTYDNLTISQWVSGFATIIRDESDLSLKNKMLEYLAEIMEDSHDFGWALAKGSHAVLLCKMEEGRITWDETNKIDRVRRAYAHRSTSQPQGAHNKKLLVKIIQPHVGIIKITPAHIKEIMKLEVDCIFTSVVNVILKAKKLAHASKDCKTKNE